MTFSKALKFSLSLAPLTILLAGCQAGRSSCIPIVPYSAAFQKQAATELRQAGPNVQRMVIDYGKQRDALRAVCR